MPAGTTAQRPTPVVGSIRGNTSTGQWEGSLDGSTWAPVSGNVPNDSVTTAMLQNDAVTFAKMQNIATGTILGRSTAGTGDVEELTTIPSGVSVPASGLTGTVPSARLPSDVFINLGTAVNSTSGTAIDFTGIPAGVRRITVIFNGVSTNGTSNYLVQLGAGSIQTTGYDSVYSQGQTGVLTVTSTQGHSSASRSAASTIRGHVVFTQISGNAWIGSGVLMSIGDAGFAVSASNVTLSGPLDRIRITTVNGTDQFDAGSINISWEF